MGQATPLHQESAAWFRARLREVGIGDRGLARRMLMAGDDREPSDILRSIEQMLAGEAEVPGEMKALLQAISEGGETEDNLFGCRIEVNRLADLVRSLGCDPLPPKP